MQVWLELLHLSSVVDDRSATKSVVVCVVLCCVVWCVCVYKCENVVQTRQPWKSSKVSNGSPDVRSEPRMLFLTFNILLI